MAEAARNGLNVPSVASILASLPAYPGQVHRSGPVDAIAIPSNVPHTVYTLDEPVKVVDARSPIFEKYIQS